MDPLKPKMALVDIVFVELMAKMLQDGLKDGRRPNGWMDLNPTDEVILEYRSALLRHYKAAVVTWNPGEEIEHLAAVANNAMILTYLVAKRAGNETS